MHKFWLTLMMVCTSVTIVLSQVTPPQEVFPGDTVTVTASGLQPADTITVSIKPSMPTNAPHQPAQPGSETAPCTSNPPVIPVPGPSAAGFSFAIPANICPGEYTVTAKKGENEFTISPRTIQVNEKPPVVTGISPKALFSDDSKSATFTFTFLGPTSLKAQDDYNIRFVDYAFPECGNDSIGPPQNGQSCFRQDKTLSQDGQIRFVLAGGNILSYLQGKRSVSLVHNGAESAKQEIIFVDASKTTPRNYAITIAVVLVVVVYLLLSSGHRTLKSRADKGRSLLTILFLDEETHTYSLSKCQFYAWTLAAILGYIFFAVAKSVIQGSAVFPDIPGGLPAIILFSAGTTVAATGITSTRGTKGAGQLHPSLADFITNGGVVAPERLQFVVWTVVGIFTFLTIVFKSDPLTLSELPTIPDGFLQLMGISSAGYLAGKLARKPGPVIKVLSITSVDLPALTLDLQGENLDPKGQIKVDRELLRGDLFSITGGAPPDPQTGFCTKLTVKLTQAAKYIEGTPSQWDHTLTLVNTDAQSADAVFPMDAMTITEVKTPANADVEVTGTNFVPETTAEWLNQQVQNAQPVAVQAQFKTDKNLTVPRPAGGQAGPSFKLTLISPVHLRASSVVDIGATIDSIDVSPNNVVVRGKGFVQQTTAQWRDNTGNLVAPDLAHNVPGPNVTFTSATQLTVDRPPGVNPESRFKLRLTSPPANLWVEKNVTF